MLRERLHLSQLSGRLHFGNQRLPSLMSNLHIPESGTVYALPPSMPYLYVTHWLLVLPAPLRSSSADLLFKWAVPPPMPFWLFQGLQCFGLSGVQLSLPELFFWDGLSFLPKRVLEPRQWILLVLFWGLFQQRDLQTVPALLFSPLQLPGVPILEWMLPLYQPDGSFQLGLRLHRCLPSTHRILRRLLSDELFALPLPLFNLHQCFLLPLLLLRSRTLRHLSWPLPFGLVWTQRCLLHVLCLLQNLSQLFHARLSELWFCRSLPSLLVEQVRVYRGSELWGGLLHRFLLRLETLRGLSFALPHLHECQLLPDLLHWFLVWGELQNDLSFRLLWRSQQFLWCEVPALLCWMFQMFVGEH